MLVRSAEKKAEKGKEGMLWTRLPSRNGHVEKKETAMNFQKGLRRSKRTTGMLLPWKEIGRKETAPDSPEGRTVDDN